MVRLGGFYGRERVSLRKNHMWFFLRDAQIVPKKGWDRTIFAGGGDFFLGLKSVAEGASICVENMV